MDGANVEMAEEMGIDNMFSFGMSVEEVRTLEICGYNAEDFIKKSPTLQQILAQIDDGVFTPEQPDSLKDIGAALRHNDRFMVCADFESYMECQEKVSIYFCIPSGVQVAATYLDHHKWGQMTLMNIASTGKFSSDRTIEEYARDIWGINDFQYSLPEPCEPK